MTVDTPSDEYKEYAPKWAKVRACLGGVDEVREKGEAYLPKLGGQSADEYNAYALRANFYEATGRTREAFTGLVFSRPSVAAMSPEIEGLSDDIDAGGTTLDDFAMHLVDEMLATGRGLIVVNHSGDPTLQTTAAERNGRPFLRFYSAESIISWRTETRNGDTMLTRIVLRECIYGQDPEDEFGLIEIEQYRVLDLDVQGYRQRVYRKNADGEYEQFGSEIRPIVGGEYWKVIPCALLSLRRGGDADPGPVPLAALAELNLSHWRTSADLEHGAHFTGLPTPVFYGVRLQQNETIRIGSADALVFEDPNASAEYLEFKGEGLGVLERLLTRKEQHMAALGARLLAPDKAGVESGDALQIRRTGETASLARIAQTVSLGLTKALGYMEVWSGNAPDASIYELNKVYASELLDSATIQALVNAWQGGAISFDTLFYNLQRGGRVPDASTAADELEKIGQEGPPLGTISDPANSNAPPANQPAA